MALDLLVNFERYSNSSIFYRTTGTFPLSVKLVETDPNIDLVSNPLSNYDVRLYINKNPIGTVFNPSDTSTILYTDEFSTSVACVCSISAAVFKNQEYIRSFDISVRFVSNFPSIDFILYPKNYINEFTQRYEPIRDIEFSKGPFFYGEGHTEEFFLSCTSFSNSFSAIWLVGNQLDSNLEKSKFQVTKQTNTTATVLITSEPSSKIQSYPVGVRLFNTQILSSGPVITYPDLSAGARAFYPFFSSTADSYNIDNSFLFVNLTGSTFYRSEFKLNEEKLDPSPFGRRKGNIKVLTYENYIPLISSTFISPFTNDTSSEYILIPSNRVPKPFRGYLYNPRPLGILQTEIIGSNFYIQCASQNPDEFWSISTPLLSTIYAYQFNLTYDTIVNDSFLPPFYVSPLYTSTLTLDVSCLKQLQLVLSGNNVPTDWKPKVVSYKYSNVGKVGPIPFIKLYTPNYYYLRDQKIPINITSLPVAPYLFVKAVVFSEYSTTKITLTPDKLSDFLQIPNAGTVNLQVELTVSLDSEGKNQETYTIIFANFVKIINQYDYVDENLFLTNLTPLSLAYSSQPRLSPNEWAIADNVNSIIEKLYKTITQLDNYTKLYVDNSKLYGWLGPAVRVSILDPLGIPQTWSDWATNCTTWTKLSTDQIIPELTWKYNQEARSQKSLEPQCFQEYCLSWRWADRKTTSRNTKVTWKLTGLNNPYKKRWTKGVCDIDAKLLNCNVESWKTSTMDPESFPVPTQIGPAECKTVAALYHKQTDTIIYANPTELHVVLNESTGKRIARRGIADDRFSFQNISGLAVSSEGRVVVLDSILSRITVLDVVKNPSDLNLVISWGTYGSSDNPRGFNKPRDIHIDQNNSLWVTDTGNKRIKKLTIVGKQINIFYDERFNDNPPISVCVDSKFNLHCLHNNGVYVFSEKGLFLFEYTFPSDITGVTKINTSYNRECVYITHSTGVVKYFRTGKIAYHPLKDVASTYPFTLKNFKSITQDLYRNCYITVDDKIIKMPDIQIIEESKAPLPTSLYWPMSSLMIHKEEYIQPWVYLKSFHRLWDNIELIRSSLAYEENGCKSYTAPIHTKEDLVIGQNEIVTNATINRLSQQIWENMQGIINYFDPDCKN